ncbi:MAG TPA: hypothetical protein VLL28_14370 [Hyphomicrobiaceae bacterium]|nr:hypothetical protein [Hyphomicrobiaceae bacterium]
MIASWDVAGRRGFRICSRTVTSEVAAAPTEPQRSSWYANLCAARGELIELDWSFDGVDLASKLGIAGGSAPATSLDRVEGRIEPGVVVADGEGA